MQNNDLISRDEALRMLKFKKNWCYGSGSMEDIDKVMQDIKNLPTVDAVEVVRCKDCIHCGTGYGGETDSIKVCEYANYIVGKNGYCVYGERKMDLEVQ